MMSLSKGYEPRDRYTPSYTEIWERAEMIQWMSAMEWPLCVVDAIMYDDSPTPETVRSMIWTHGPIKALEILIRFLDD